MVCLSPVECPVCFLLFHISCTMDPVSSTLQEASLDNAFLSARAGATSSPLHYPLHHILLGDCQFLQSAFGVFEHQHYELHT